jgi:WD40 repeat protein
VTVDLDDDRVLAVAVSPDGRLLAGAGFGKAVLLWDARSGTLLRSLEAPKRTPRRAIAFSPDGQMLAGSGDDGVVRLWNVRTGSLERSLPGPAGRQHLQSIAISPDGLRLAVAGARGPGQDGRSPGEVTLIDLKTGKARWTRPGDKWVYRVAFAPDGKTLAVADGAVRLLDSETGALVKALPLENRLWDARTGKLLRTVPGELSEAWDLAFSPDAKSLLSCDGEVVALTETLTGLRRLALMKRTLKPVSPE